MQSKSNYLYDYSELLGKLRAKNITQEQLAKQISLSPSTLNQKLNNKSEFSQREMTKICKALDIPLEYISIYFFCSYTLENAS